MGCNFLDGNLELTHFKKKPGRTYDFSFLQNITEITGYIIVFNSDIDSLPLSNLRIVRGWKVYNSKFSVYIDSNDNLEYLDFQNLKGSYIF